MKNSILLILTMTLILSSCDTNMPERTIGFVTGDNAELQWHLGTQEAIDVVTTVDELWTNQDYEAMRPYFADSVKVWRPNGVYTDTFDSFIESLNNVRMYGTWRATNSKTGKTGAIKSYVVLNFNSDGQVHTATEYGDYGSMMSTFDE